MSLERFKTAQDSPRSGLTTALAELRSGRKTSHWIWYIFPQLAGLGRSWTAQEYAIRDLDEAIEYLRDPVLGERLIRATDVVAEQLVAGVSLSGLMGGTLDAMKLVSSLTLFELAAEEIAVTARMEVSGFVRDCGCVLEAASTQGLPRCAFTLTHAKR